MEPASDAVSGYAPAAVSGYAPAAVSGYAPAAGYAHAGGYSAAADFVTVRSSTWGRESHELFDFEARPDDLHSKVFRVQISGTAYRTGSDVEVHDANVMPTSKAEALVKVVRRNGIFYVDRAPVASGNRTIWTVVHDLGPRGHQIRQDDIMRLGRLKFRVKQMVASGQKQLDFSFSQKDRQSECVVDPEMQAPDRTCRICLSDGASEDDPLISPCQCKGSVELVHLNCLRQWTKRRIRVFNSNGSFFYRPLVCELCNSTYPTYLSTPPPVGNKDALPTKELLVEIPRMESPYVVLECVKPERLGIERFGFLVVAMDDQEVTLGRGQECDIRLGDNSMSRLHASIRIQHGRFWITDHGSKFGTLVAMRQPTALKVFQPMSLQVGRTLLSMTVSSPAPIAWTPPPAPPPGLLPACSFWSAQDELLRSIQMGLLQGCIEGESPRESIDGHGGQLGEWSGHVDDWRRPIPVSPSVFNEGHESAYIATDGTNQQTGQAFTRRSYSF